MRTMNLDRSTVEMTRGVGSNTGPWVILDVMGTLCNLVHPSSTHLEWRCGELLIQLSVASVILYRCSL